VGGADVDCDVYEMNSKAGKEKAWIVAGRPAARARPCAGSPAVASSPEARDRDADGRLEDLRLREDGRRGDRRAARRPRATRWWTRSIRWARSSSVSGSVTIEAVKAGDDWTKRPPFPS
jgi:hypothetical protein